MHFPKKKKSWCDCAFLFIVRSVSYEQLLRVKAGRSIIYLFYYVNVIAVGGKCQREMAFEIKIIL